MLWGVRVQKAYVRCTYLFDVTNVAVCSELSTEESKRIGKDETVQTRTLVGDLGGVQAELAQFDHWINSLVKGDQVVIINGEGDGRNGKKEGNGDRNLHR